MSESDGADATNKQLKARIVELKDERQRFDWALQAAKQEIEKLKKENKNLRGKIIVLELRERIIPANNRKTELLGERFDCDGERIPEKLSTRVRMPSRCDEHCTEHCDED